MSKSDDPDQRQRLLDQIDQILTGRHEEIIRRAFDEALIRIELIQNELQGVHDCYSAIVCGPDPFSSDRAFYLEHIAIRSGDLFENYLLDGNFVAIKELLFSGLTALSKASEASPKTKSFNEILSIQLREAITAAGTESTLDLIHKMILITSIAHASYVISSDPETSPSQGLEIDRDAILREVKGLIGY